jgi:hypothetical protein
MPVDSSDIDNALLAKLIADTGVGGLMTLATDGVYWEAAPPSKTKFVVVSLVDHHDEPMFGGRAFEDATYLVKFVELATTGGSVKAGAARIDTLLEGGTLSISGYSLMLMRRESRVRMTEVDDIDPQIRWQHRGGIYQVVVSP